MENKLTTITQLPLTEVISIGKAFAESGMFTDTKSAAQAIVKIQAGQEIGIPPFAAMTGIHIIQGKPTIGAGLIAARVKGSGKYDYKVTEQTEKNCSIEFYQGKDKIGVSAFSIEDAKKAGTKNIDKFPRNMLFARAISNGVKWYCPDVFSGPVYVPEEMDVPIKTEDVTHEEVVNDFAYAVGLIKQCTTFEELSNVWIRLDKDCQSHYVVIDAITEFMVSMINASGNLTTLQSVWTSIGTIGKAKEFQQHEGIKAAKDAKKKEFEKQV